MDPLEEFMKEPNWEMLDYTKWLESQYSELTTKIKDAPREKICSFCGMTSKAHQPWTGKSCPKGEMIEYALIEQP